ncbi:MAG: hypothetical protein ACE5KH_02135 [Candidatus Geothermarchaeales archaeon]
MMSIDAYMRFATRCREQVEEMFQKHGFNSESDVGSRLLVELVEQVRALTVGEFFRGRTLTGHYARILLLDYMFSELPNKKTLTKRVIDEMLFQNPTHDFEMDFHICKKLGLPVQRMDLDEFQKTRAVTMELKTLTEEGVVCRDIEDDYKMPFIRLYTNL